MTPVARRSSSGSAPRLILYTHLGYPLVLRALVALRRHADARTRAPGSEPPRVSLIVAAFDEEEVIAAKVANALALDYPRERLELIVASDGSADATVERARAAGADLVLDLPPRRQGRRPERRRRARRRRDPRLLRRQQRLVARRPPPPGRALRRPRRRLRLRPGALPRLRRRQPRGLLLALRDGGARDGVGAGRGHRRQRRDLRRAPRRLHPAAAVRQPRPLASRSCSPSAACARSTCPGRAPRRRWCRRWRASSPASGG